MPGLRRLEAGHRCIRVSYRPIRLGALVTFRTEDALSRRALARWLAAQRADHGSHGEHPGHGGNHRHAG